MAAVLVPVILVLILLVAGAISLRRFVRREGAHGDRLRDDREGTVRYLVPPGQDPAAVLAGLGRQGYDAVPDPSVGQPRELLIAARHDGRIDREEVRRVLAGITDLNLEGDQVTVPDVRFMDESGGA